MTVARKFELNIRNQRLKLKQKRLTNPVCQKKIFNLLMSVLTGYINMNHTLHFKTIEILVALNTYPRKKYG